MPKILSKTGSHTIMIGVVAVSFCLTLLWRIHRDRADFDIDPNRIVVVSVPGNPIHPPASGRHAWEAVQQLALPLETVPAADDASRLGQGQSMPRDGTASKIFTAVYKTYGTGATRVSCAFHQCDILVDASSVLTGSAGSTSSVEGPFKANLLQNLKNEGFSLTQDIRDSSAGGRHILSISVSQDP